MLWIARCGSRTQGSGKPGLGVPREGGASRCREAWVSLLIREAFYHVR